MLPLPFIMGGLYLRYVSLSNTIHQAPVVSNLSSPKLHLSQFSSPFLSHSLLKDLLLYTLPILHYLCELEVLPGDTDTCYFSLPSDYVPWAFDNSHSIFLWPITLLHVTPCGLGGADFTSRSSNRHVPNLDNEAETWDFSCNNWGRRAPFLLRQEAELMCPTVKLYLPKHSLYSSPFLCCYIDLGIPTMDPWHGREPGAYKEVSYKLIL